MRSQLLETAVRLAQPPAAIAVGGARLASALGAPFPSVVVVRPAAALRLLDDPRRARRSGPSSARALRSSCRSPPPSPRSAASCAPTRCGSSSSLPQSARAAADDRHRRVEGRARRRAAGAVPRRPRRLRGVRFFANDPDEITMYSLKPETLPAASSSPIAAPSTRSDGRARRRCPPTLCRRAQRSTRWSRRPSASARAAAARRVERAHAASGFEPPPGASPSTRAAARRPAAARAQVPLEVGLDAAAPSGEDVVSMDDDDDDDASEWRRFDDEDEDE